VIAGEWDQISVMLSQALRADFSTVVRAITAIGISF
jgi:hypothetical protein